MGRVGKLAAVGIAAALSFGVSGCGGDDGADVRNLDEDAGSGTHTGSGTGTGSGTHADTGTDADTGTGTDS